MGKLERIKKLQNFYSKLYLSKASVIAIIISFLISLSYIFYFIYSNKDIYPYNYKNVNSNYFENSFSILNIIIVFISLFPFIKEANLTEDSNVVMFEASFGRISVFISKQLAIILISFIISLSYFLIFYIPPYFFMSLFKIDLIKSFLSVYIYSISIIEVSLFIDYLFKNYFVSCLVGIFILISSFIDNFYISYLIPIIKINGIEICLANNIFYAILYLLTIVVLNTWLYLKIDRK